MNEGAATATPDPFCRTGDIVQQAGTGSPQPQHQTSGFPAQLALNGSPFSRSKHYGMQTVRPYVGVVKSISLHIVSQSWQVGCWLYGPDFPHRQTLDGHLAYSGHQGATDRVTNDSR